MSGAMTVTSNKVYDGTTAATITAHNLSGKVGTEDVSLSGGSATFSSPGAGDNKTVTGTGFVLAGVDHFAQLHGADLKVERFQRHLQKRVRRIR